MKSTYNNLEQPYLKVEVLQVESCDVIEDDLLMGGGGGGFAQLELWETLLWKKARLGLIFRLLLPPDGKGLGAAVADGGGGIPENKWMFFS